MTAENRITECRLCPGRVCTDQGDGRLINDNNGVQPINKEKIHFNTVPIADCELRESLETTDERNLVGS